MFLIAVSGGPDSMYLLNQLFKKYGNQKIAVAHVNYSKRETAIRDQKIVENYCHTKNIKLFIKTINPKIYELEDFKNTNFQNWAREIRYKFFSDLYKKYDFQKLYVAHHLDDNLATYLWQKNQKRNPSFFGIRKKRFFKNMVIERPLLKISKSFIIKKLIKEKIIFGNDESNDLDIYTRNQNNKIISKNYFFKMKLIIELFFKNFFKKFENQRINQIYKNWSIENYSINFFKESKKQKQILFRFIYEHLENVQLSSQKLESMVSYIVAFNNESKHYKIDKNHFLYKKNKTLKIG
ncbi:tRNA lysidine(34) synthetase TilS [Mycoplasmopsis agassizii]|uniref:tRNA lysidine(34) synthetase TilS n=1 Tax=Mycoplasmopsis agassizii TaxID=33922 RepID=UPI003527DF22